MKKIMYGFGIFSFITIVLHFWGYSREYTKDELVSGIVFFIIAGIVYFLFVFFFFKGETGKKTVFWGLIVVILILLYLLFTKDFEKEHALIHFAESTILST